MDLFSYYSCFKPLSHGPDISSNIHPVNTCLLGPGETYCFPESSVDKWFIIISSVKVNKNTVNKTELILLFNNFNSFNIIK